MQRALFLLFTVACGALGWFAGSAPRVPQAAVITNSLSTPVPVQAESVGALSPTDPVTEARELVAKLSADFPDFYADGELSARLFRELRDLKSDGFVSVIANLRSEGKWVHGEAARLLVGYWAERDLPAARAWVLGLDKKVASHLGDALFETWAVSDLRGMYDWLDSHAEELPTKGHRESAGFQFAKAAWRLDPERGIALVRRLEPDAAHLWNLFNQWAEHDPAAAAGRLLRELDEKVRDNLIFAVTSAWAPRDPAAARAWAETIPDPLVAAKTVTQIGSTVGWRDPRAGADFLVQIPQTNATRAALKNTVNKWAERDLDAALGWTVALKNKALADWVSSAVAADLPADQRAKAEARWRELRAAGRSANPLPTAK